jgi:transposase
MARTDRSASTKQYDGHAVIADKAYDADQRVLEPLAAASKSMVIPTKANRRKPRLLDRDMYGTRPLIENFFGKIKQFCAIVTWFDETARNFLAAGQLPQRRLAQLATRPSTTVVISA